MNKFTFRNLSFPNLIETPRGSHLLGELAGLDGNEGSGDRLEVRLEGTERHTTRTLHGLVKQYIKFLLKFLIILMYFFY